MVRLQRLSALYDLGLALGPIETILGALETIPRIVPWSISAPIGFLKAVLGHVIQDRILPFNQTKKSAIQLNNVIDEIFNRRAATNSLMEPFIQVEIDQLKGAATDLTLALRHEIDAMPVFFVTERRAYVVDILIEDAVRIFSQSETLLLSETTKTDIREAGRCIAFGLATATGFHSVRAVEAVARGYHQIIVGSARPGGETPLGPLINDLRTKRDALLLAKMIEKEDLLNLVIETLARLNNVYRKPITHPELILGPSQAMTVFDFMKCALNLILEDAPKKSLTQIPDGFF